MNKSLPSIQLGQSYSYIMRKVWYHQIWIQNNLGFMVLILTYICTFLSLRKKFENRFYRCLWCVDCLLKKTLFTININGPYFSDLLFLYWKFLSGKRSKQQQTHDREMIMFLSPQTTTLSIRIHQYTRYCDSIEIASLFGLHQSYTSQVL